MTGRTSALTWKIDVRRSATVGNVVALLARYILVLGMVKTAPNEPAIRNNRFGYLWHLVAVGGHFVTTRTTREVSRGGIARAADIR